MTRGKMEWSKTDGFQKKKREEENQIFKGLSMWLQSFFGKIPMSIKKRFFFLTFTGVCITGGEKPQHKYAMDDMFSVSQAAFGAPS